MSDREVSIACEARGLRFEVRIDPALAGILGTILSGLVAESPHDPIDGAATFALRWVDGAWHVLMDEQLMMQCEQPSDAVHGLMVFITKRVIGARDDLLSIHAAAVGLGAMGVLLPASSGSGKTTLCARLIQRGAAYLSDDSVGLDPEGQILAYPKPLSFKWGAQDRFDDIDLSDLELGGDRQPIWQVPPDRLGAVSIDRVDPRVIVVPRFQAGTELNVQPIAPHLAAAEVFTQVQNLTSVGVPFALDQIGALVARCHRFALSYGDARHAADAIVDLTAAAALNQERPVAYAVTDSATPSVPTTEPFPPASVTALHFDSGALLVDGSTGGFATIDSVGARVWTLLDGQRDAAAIAHELAAHFDAPRMDIEADVKRWIDQLLERGFLRPPLPEAGQHDDGGGGRESNPPDGGRPSQPL